MAVMIAMGCAGASAQYDQTISVDGKYVPDVIAHERQGVFPTPVRFAVDGSPLEYDSRGVPASFAPQLLASGATGWRDTRRYSDARGYLDAGAGSWLNSTLSFGYRIVDTDRDVFGVRLQHLSTSLSRKHYTEKDDYMLRGLKGNFQRRYDERLGLYYTHDFGTAGRLNAEADWHWGYFNYFGLSPQVVQLPTVNPERGTQASRTVTHYAPWQTLNDGSVRVGMQSPGAIDDIQWHVTAGARYFGYRRLYDMTETSYMLGSETGLSPVETGGRETDISLEGGFSFPTSTKSAFGIDLEGHALLYAKHRDRAAKEIGGYEGVYPSPADYGVLTLTPYYRFGIERLALSIGARIDLLMNARKDDGRRYGTFRIAPDVRLDYNAGPVSLYLHLLGGTRLNTLASARELDYYALPALTSTAPEYTPLDGKLGVQFGPFSGFSAGVDFAFRTTRGQRLGGWYMTMLEDGNAGDDPERRCDYAGATTMNLTGYSVGVNLGYDAGRYFKVTAAGSYQPQSGEKGYFNGLDRPRWLLGVAAETNPWSTLKFKVSYDYRGVRKLPLYSYHMDLKTGALSDPRLEMHRLPDITLLNFGVSYGITRDFTVWGQADNLLDRRDDYLPLQPQQGITLSLGFDWTLR